MTRRIENSIEVPGTPEEVWEAIATSHGIECWFVPARVGDGRVALDMGDGMEDAGTVIASEPPRRFVYEEEWEAVEGEPPGRLASEFLVEAKAGGTCVVRLVSTLFGSSADWEDEIGGMSDGWQSYMHNLRLYLTHWVGQRCSPVTVSGDAAGTLDEGWATLTAALGLEGAEVGDRVATSGGPRLAGTVERRTGGSYHQELLLRLAEPAPGTAFVLVYRYQERLHPAIRAYLFGEGAPAVAERERGAWQKWMDERFASRAVR
jgi:uncharacterized protein YndB with AHSA1/START domain